MSDLKVSAYACAPSLEEVVIQWPFVEPSGRHGDGANESGAVRPRRRARAREVD